MDKVKLSTLFTLQTLDKDLYEGQSWDLGFRAIFGGQVLGQALIAAYKSVSKDRIAHSLHSYFLLPGDATAPVSYHVEVLRDGRSFSTRRIKATQNSKTIFEMTASFKEPEEALSHQFSEMPSVPLPEEVVPDIRFYEDNFDNLPNNLKDALIYHRPIDVRTVDAAHSFAAIKRVPQRAIWLRCNEDFHSDEISHQAALAYASDYHFLSTSLQAHGIAVQDKNLKLATIDHALWFHKPFSFNEWILYVTESPISGNARGFVQGKLYNQKGELVATAVQEGLIRKVK